MVEHDKDYYFSLLHPSPNLKKEKSYLLIIFSYLLSALIILDLLTLYFKVAEHSTGNSSIHNSLVSKYSFFFVYKSSSGVYYRNIFLMVIIFATIIMCFSFGFYSLKKSDVRTTFHHINLFMTIIVLYIVLNSFVFEFVLFYKFIKIGFGFEINLLIESLFYFITIFNYYMFKHNNSNNFIEAILLFIGALILVFVFLLTVLLFYWFLLNYSTDRLF